MKERSRVELFEDIRRGHRDDGLSIRELSVKHKVHRRAVRQALASAVPPGRKKPERSFPVAARWEPIVREWLLADVLVHRKQRHTAQRIWERLVDEHGAQISSSTVRAMVVRLRTEIGVTAGQVTIGQVHAPGAEAEVDFGEFYADLGEGLVKVHMFVMRLSCSGRAVHYAYSAPSSEAFLDGHVRAFAAFGGVPGRIRYDNLTAAVTSVLLGRGRIENQRFVGLRSHYGFDSFFCIPGVEGAHEKGGVEGEIGRFRRRHLTPVPVLAGTAALNAVMHAADRSDDHRHIAGRRENVGAAFAAEAPALMALPAEVFDPSTIVSARVDSKARVAVRACHYSVPARLAGRRVEVAIGGMTITVREHGTVVAVHERSIGKGQETLVLDHFLEVLLRKPGALAGATALAQAKAAGTFTPLHQQFWDTARKAGDGPGTKALIGVLLLHRTMTADAVGAGMKAALAVGSTDPDAVAVEARRHADQRSVPLLAATGTAPVPDIAWHRPAPALNVYDSLLTK